MGIGNRLVFGRRTLTFRAKQALYSQSGVISRRSLYMQQARFSEMGMLAALGFWVGIWVELQYRV